MQKEIILSSIILGNGDFSELQSLIIMGTVVAFVVRLQNSLDFLLRFTTRFHHKGTENYSLINIIVFPYVRYAMLELLPESRKKKG
jgi:hypothetical protein